ncbi:UDP-N-acetylmuramoyl-L-alanine--D-glutamate ligase [Chitiniphilus eburneus]|uniref:UDP-N-acetylmuramoylalanine--D-glutamate ligase n=1 Tax=Chitiniphilus eburneus TaxID=2571148 RepID=A0A4U0Q833_9NEIS|nr:UDP-N-acetylmuramoyl-L-alanine--D-glutamate ligase [Chitiniphilus eburneus]TJZ77423.1 UDP-N-acetylmuramoyl-L-alanine--D-glutamate ligase [Chitiniphilus eburneus]
MANASSSPFAPNPVLSRSHAIVVGLGITGLSAARWLASQGARVTVADSREQPPSLDELRNAVPQATLRLGAFSVETFADADLLVVSPGVPLATPAIDATVRRGIPAVGDVELFARAIAGRPAKVIAITGSNGKSTVTTMVGQMCEAAGLRTVVAGNIGLPVLDALAATPDADVYVLELSSFQLETTSTLAPDAATVLNVSEDHLDRYQGMVHYAATKAHIFHGQGAMILNREDEYSRDMGLPGRHVIRFGQDAPRRADEYGLVAEGNDFALRVGDSTLLRASDLPVAGLHNAVNALAALALCRAIGLPPAPLVKALKGFKGLPHRVEFVANVDGVGYYDDSKGTNVGATEAALKGMTRPVVLIAGGDGKGQDFGPLKPACARICRAVVLIGRDGPQIAAALEGTEAGLAGGMLPLVAEPTLEQAVRTAANLAQRGDVVLLSPACASLDMFRNYHHRAEVFIDAVRALEPAAP